MDAIRRIVSLRLAKSESYCPVGWTKCGACGYHERCWTQAEARHDVAVISGVDQGLASALQQQGIGSYEKLLAAFDEGSLAGLSRPWGQGSQRVGKKAGSILRAAKAVTTGKEIVLGSPAIPAHDNYVMFDLEGLPPQLDDMGKIYLWGMQVFGKRPGPYMAATAGFGDGGDRQGWDDFLAKAETIFAEYGDIPFVHWAPYEKTHLGEYVERFGDRKGIAARVKRNLLDLLPITRESVALPLPSYSLKVVEVHVGFKRTQDEYGGNWSMAKYIEATELQDEAERAAVMDQILTYNREDLEATWAVFKWLRAKIR
jgi:predicted RecB family nuclease